MRMHFPRFAEKRKPLSPGSIPRIDEPPKKQAVILSLMDYKEEIGRRIRGARDAKEWTLADLSQKTGDVLTVPRINAYENADRMPGPTEIAILAKALGVRPAYLMALDDNQLPISQQEEAMIRNWRALPENERMDFFRRIQTRALQHRDPVQDHVVEQHLPQPRRARVK